MKEPLTNELLQRFRGWQIRYPSLDVRLLYQGTISETSLSTEGELFFICHWLAEQQVDDSSWHMALGKAGEREVYATGLYQELSQAQESYVEDIGQGAFNLIGNGGTIAQFYPPGHPSWLNPAIIPGIAMLGRDWAPMIKKTCTAIERRRWNGVQSNLPIGFIASAAIMLKIALEDFANEQVTINDLVERAIDLESPADMPYAEVAQLMLEEAAQGV